MTLTGILLLLLAGFAQGSFGLGMKHQGKLSWESFWFVYSLVAMLIIPVAWGVISDGNFFTAIFNTESAVLYKSMLLGFLWGIGGILFGVSIKYVGISITNGMVMGLAGGLGAIIPLFGIEGATTQPSFIYVILGVAIMLIGVALSALSGVMYTKETSDGSAQSNTNKKAMVVGLIIAVTSGVLSSLLNIGFEAATPVTEQAQLLGMSDASSGLPSRAVVVFGGLIMNLGYAIILLTKNKNWSELCPAKLTKDKRTSFIWAKLTGLLWFLPLGLSGIVAVSIGELGNVITWPVMLALSLIFGNIWGYVTGEWKGAKKSFLVMILASVLLIVACLILTFRDSLAAA